MDQQQFLDVIDRDEAERRFRAAFDPRPLDAEFVPLGEAGQRVLAADIVAPVDVPGFDRSNMDGFAVRAEDTFGATEEAPRFLRLTGENIGAGKAPARTVEAGSASGIATGAMLPRGADAVVMIEFTDVTGDSLCVRRPVTPGANITYAGADIGRGETVLRRGDVLTSREAGVIAALGISQVPVLRRPYVAILSTGDEVIAPGGSMRPGGVFDSNAAVLAEAVRELGGVPVPLGIVPDDEDSLRVELYRALACDMVLLSGGTSKGMGDLSYRVVASLGEPGIVAHGVALKPGKPLCLAVVRRPWSLPQDAGSDSSEANPLIPVVILPGFPTSAVFTFQEFVAPVLRRMAGRSADPSGRVQARLPLRVNSERGRTEFVLVNLVASAASTSELPAYAAYPLGKGSGSVTTFARADGFVVIPRQREYLEAEEEVEVVLLGSGLRPADLMVIGSHCVGLDRLLGRLQERGHRSKFLAVGSNGGLAAARRGECDLAGIHLLDPATNRYNEPFLNDSLTLLRGYGRLQGIVHRPGDSRFEGRTVAEAVAAALADETCVLANRNRGSGTRILIDGLLGSAQPAGHRTEARSHNAVVAAVAQGRADWGVAIETVARLEGLGFLPLQAEQYDFVVPKSRLDRPAVQAFRGLLAAEETKRELRTMGFTI